MRHVSRTHRVALDWLFDRINFGPKIQIKYIDTKKPTCPTFQPKEISHVTNEIIFCVCSTFAISVLQFVLKWCQKERKKQSGEERVTAKSRPRMSLIARAPSTLSSSASESPGKISYESQSPWSAKAEEYDRTVKPLLAVTQVTSQCTTTNNLLKARTQHATQGGTMTKLGLLKSGKANELMDDSTGTPVCLPEEEHTSSNQVSLMRRPSTLFWKKKMSAPQRGARPQPFIIGDDETELDLSLGPRSFLDRVND